MSKGVMDLTLWQMIAAYVFIVILLAIVRWRKINREKEIIISTIRMSLQLVLVAYILTYIFKIENPWLTLLVIALMETFAIRNIIARVKTNLNRSFKRVIIVSMLAGTVISLFYFMIVVIRNSPWYNPQYFIPLAGMIIGNSMTGITLGVDRMVEGMRSKRLLIESALMMGATPKAASKTVMNHAFDSAIIPTVNNMVGMGIVFLPGMMTGQILSGISPLKAITYQIAIMLGITGSVSLCVITFVVLGYRSFFTKDGQLLSASSESAQVMQKE